MPSSPGRTETREEESGDPELPPILREEVDVTECDRAVLEKRVIALEAEVLSREKTVATLEESLTREKKRRQGVIERYERILDRKGHRGETADGNQERPPPGRSGSAVAAVRGFVDGLVSRLR